MHPRPPPAVPVANLFLTSDMRYPALASSTSTPDRVLPSLLNWAATGLGLLGPQRGSQLAESRPQPGGTAQGLLVLGGGVLWGPSPDPAPLPRTLRAGQAQPHLPAPGHRGCPAASRAASSLPGSCRDTGTSPSPQTPKAHPALPHLPPLPTSLPSSPHQHPHSISQLRVPLSHPGVVWDPWSCVCPPPPPPLPAGRGLQPQVGDGLIHGQQDVDVGEGHGQGQRAGVVAVLDVDPRGARRAVPAHAQPQRCRAGAQPRKLVAGGGFGDGSGGHRDSPTPRSWVRGPGGPSSPQLLARAHLVLEQSHVVVGSGRTLLRLFLQVPGQCCHVQPEVLGAGVALGWVAAGTGSEQQRCLGTPGNPAPRCPPPCRCTHRVPRMSGPPGNLRNPLYPGTQLPIAAPTGSRGCPSIPGNQVPHVPRYAAPCRCIRRFPDAWAPLAAPVPQYQLPITASTTSQGPCTP